MLLTKGKINRPGYKFFKYFRLKQAVKSRTRSRLVLVPESKGPYCHPKQSFSGLHPDGRTSLRVNVLGVLYQIHSQSDRRSHGQSSARHLQTGRVH